MFTKLSQEFAFVAIGKKVVTDLCRSMAYSLLRQEGADLFSFSQSLTRPANFWRRGFHKQCL